MNFAGVGEWQQGFKALIYASIASIMATRVA